MVTSKSAGPPQASTLTTGQIAELVGGQLVGRRDTIVTGVAALDRAGPTDLSFLASGRYLPYFERTSAGAVLTTPEFRDVPTGSATLVLVDDARIALSCVLDTMYPEPQAVWGIHPTARVASGARWNDRISLGAHATLGANAQLGSNCIVGPFAVIEDHAVLGDTCRIGAHALIHARTLVGNRVVIKAGARVGSSGFGYVQAGSEHKRINHVGRCVLGDDVEVGANATVDRGSLDETVIGKGTKIDNLVQVGHNVRIGARCLIMAQVGVAGSVTVEDDVVLAGQAGLAGHLTVGRRARVAAQAGVIGNIPVGATVSGYPARSHREVLRQTAALKKLATMTPAIERLLESNVGE